MVSFFFYFIFWEFFIMSVEFYQIYIFLNQLRCISGLFILLIWAITSYQDNMTLKTPFYVVIWSFQTIVLNVGGGGGTTTFNLYSTKKNVSYILSGIVISWSSYKYIKWLFLNFFSTLKNRFLFYYFYH